MMTITIVVIAVLGLLIWVLNKGSKYKPKLAASVIDPLTVHGTDQFKECIYHALKIIENNGEAISSTRLIRLCLLDHDAGAFHGGETVVNYNYMEHDPRWMAAILVHEDEHHLHGYWDTSCCDPVLVRQERVANRRMADFLKKTDYPEHAVQYVYNHDGRHFDACYMKLIYRGDYGEKEIHKN